MITLRERLRAQGSIPVSSGTKVESKTARFFCNSSDKPIGNGSASKSSVTDQSRAWIGISEALASYDPIPGNGDMRKRHELGAHKANKHRMARPTGHNFSVRQRQEDKIARRAKRIGAN